MPVRVLSGNRGDLPYWSHLRPQHRDRVRESVYLNRIRLSEWRQIFEESLPGATIILPDPKDSGNAELLARLRQEGELSEYTDEELLTVAVRAMWKKPEAQSGS